MLGLDVSSTSVKLVELSDTGKGAYRVERYVIEPLPKDSVNEGNIVNMEQVAETIQRAWKTLGSRVRHVAMALPSNAVITKKILAPASLTGIELENQVESEANQVIPFPLDEVNLDFQVLGPAANSPNDVQILVAAARKEKVEDRVAAAEASGLKSLVMDVEAYATQLAYEAMANQLPSAGAGQTIAIIDIGASAMHINILHDNDSVYLRDHGFGGSQLNHEISRRYGMTNEEAEVAKRKGTLPENYEVEVLQPYSETLAMEIGRALQLFTTSTQYHKVDQILLAGGGAMIPGLDDVVANRTGISTMVANPFSNMAVGPKIRPQELANDAPALFVACGLALRRFDPQ
ncbi:MAG TPA: pilus assembly protein PilM [Thiobacillaceae bacterium]|nr:pilus assembly protein PilM [Thiobacillaceae bacterium]